MRYIATIPSPTCETTTPSPLMRALRVLFLCLPLALAVLLVVASSAAGQQAPEPGATTGADGAVGDEAAGNGSAGNESPGSAAPDEGGVAAAGAPSGTARGSAAVLQARRLPGGEPVLDGVIEASEWSGAAHTSDFVEFRPNEGATPPEPTELWILYGADALWVAVRSHDSEPDSIAAQLTRRDGNSYSDEVIVAVDSYLDRRTAFAFGVNPAGVKKDIYIYEDGREDSSWDPVWDVAVSRDSGGWSAEYRIPYNQLRFSGAPTQDWGFSAIRLIARHDAQYSWPAISQQVSGIVSQFGTLEGLEELDTPRRLEVEPYSMARVERAPGDAENPFYASNDFFGTVGADIEYGVTNNLTLNVALNPDFGQVEADPGEVNLSAFESFFSERRPFFLEGRNIYEFGVSGGNNSESLFYSRRVGRSPQGSADRDGGYADVPSNTTILGAAKLSGKTEGGWSIGVMNAVTAEESADVFTGNEERLEQALEPRTNYSVARIQRDFRDGYSALGAIATSTIRDREVADAHDLHRSAFSGGVDARHRFGQNGNYQVVTALLGSRVQGSADAIEDTQRASVHYYQRPDHPNATLDPNRTSLTGWAGRFALAKIGGGYWRSTYFLEARSPGFEINDLGFQNQSNTWVTGGFLGYHVTEPGEHLRRWALNVNTHNVSTLGGERLETGGNVNGNLALHNLWGGNTGIGYNNGGVTTNLLRGGPSIRTEDQWNGWGSIYSDSRRPLEGNFGWNWNVWPESESWNLRFNTNFTWRASASATVRFQPFVQWREIDNQWVRRVTVSGEVDGTGDAGSGEVGGGVGSGDGGVGVGLTGDGREYLFGRLDQRTVGLTTRFQVSFTPDLSLQLYAQPFLSAGSYGDFKKVVEPMGDRYEDRYAGISPVRSGSGDDAEYAFDFDADGTAETFDDPDFNSLQFQSNVVLRWEYRPGSTLFLVWSQSRDGDGLLGEPDFGNDLDGLFGAHPSNTFLIKASYWLNP